MTIYYPAYLLLQKTYSEQLRTLKNFTVYKANEWEDDFGKKIQSSMVFDAIAFLERKKLLNVTSFRECSTCSMTEEGRQACKKFESSEEYRMFRKSGDSLALNESNMQHFFAQKNREQYQEKQRLMLIQICSAFFGAL
jgi:hypothetical protein